MKTSEELVPFRVYTREDLKSMFEIKNATINTGVFSPKGHDSIWLFVTEDKTADRVQYEDRLQRNTLYWEGQQQGRTDMIIIEHKQQGLELLFFYRKKKYEHKGAGFRFEGKFKYVSHSGGVPTQFILKRVE